MNNAQFIERVAEVFAEELHEPERWWYLSFAGEEGWRGAIIVRAKGILSALSRCNVLGINPHGEVMSHFLPDEVSSDAAFQIDPEPFKERLLTLEECKTLFGDVVRSSELEKM